MIVLDEAAYINEDLFHETIIPLLELKFVALIAISTPLDENNCFTKLVQLKDENGNEFIKTIHLIVKKEEPEKSLKPTPLHCLCCCRRQNSYSMGMEANYSDGNKIQ